jgi:hypothetical protein
VAQAPPGLQRDDRAGDRPLIDRGPGHTARLARNQVDPGTVPLYHGATRGHQILIVKGTGQLSLPGMFTRSCRVWGVLVAIGELAVDDAVSGGHPLHVPRGQRAGVTKAVAVLEDPVDDQCHGLQATVRVPVPAAA